VISSCAVIGRLVRSADFERVLGVPSRARSFHFAVHHVADRPGRAKRSVIHPVSTELSTGLPTTRVPAVDDQPPEAPVEGIWLCAVIPKRHARRSVTRSLLKRQIRAAVQRQAGLPAGLWVVRLRTPFDRTLFPSAASTALRRAAHDELDGLLAEAVRRSARS
jgi:ribonuclease P protein component